MHEIAPHRVPVLSEFLIFSAEHEKYAVNKIEDGRNLERRPVCAFFIRYDDDGLESSKESKTSSILYEESRHRKNSKIGSHFSLWPPDNLGTSLESLVALGLDGIAVVVEVRESGQVRFAVAPGLHNHLVAVDDLVHP